MEATFKNNKNLVLSNTEQLKPVFINKAGKLVKVKPEDFVCIEANRSYCKIYMSGYEKPFELCHSMASVLRSLPDGLLTPVGRSHAINKEHVTEIRETTVLMDNGLLLTVSANGMKSLREEIIILG